MNDERKKVLLRSSFIVHRSSLWMKQSSRSRRYTRPTVRYDHRPARHMANGEAIMRVVRVGLVGSNNSHDCLPEALRSVPGAEVVAVTSATEAHAAAFAACHGIPQWFTDYRKMYALPDLDLVVLGLPNDLHADATVAAAQAGKHVVCEKPLCLNL